MDILCRIGTEALINWSNVEEVKYTDSYNSIAIVIYFKSGRKKQLEIDRIQLESLKNFMASQKDLLHYKAHDALKPDRSIIKTDIPQ